MQLDVSKHVSSLLTRLSGHLRIPLFRNGYALITSSLLASSIGMVYWILAARIYPTNVIGLNSALISSMMLLGGIAQLNLSNAHIRFIPAAGSSTRRLVGLTYILGPAVAFLAALVFVLRSEEWLPALSFLKSIPWLAVALIVATMAYSIFILEDGVLTGLRRATWVPVENAFFGVVKIVLMLVFVSSLPLLGVFASWLVGLAIIVGPTTYFIFQRLIPAHQQANPGRNSLPHLPEVARYITGDYIASLAWMGCTSLLPILVTQISGPTANAYYYLSWQISIILYAICTSLGSSLVVEASMNPEQLNHLSRRVFIQLTLLVIPAAVVLWIGAPIILQLFGQTYAQEGAPLLRLLSLSAIPFILITVFVSMARVERKISRAILAYLSIAVLVVGLSVIFLHRFGLLGVGYAWVTGQSVVAGGILVGWLRSAILHKTLLTRKGAGVEDHPNRINKYLDPARSYLAERKKGFADRRRVRIVNQAWPEIQKDLTSSGVLTGKDWAVQQYIRTETDRAVAVIGPSDQDPAAVVKIYLSNQALASGERQQRALNQIAALPGMDSLMSLVPRKLAEGEAAGWSYIAEKYLPGIDGRQILSDPAHTRQMQSRAVDAILRLHGCSSRRITVGSDLLDAWVNRPATILAAAAGRWPGRKRWMEGLRAVAGGLTRSLAGQTLITSWVHGDFTPGNLLYSPEEGRITGIVDWELANPGGQPILDVYQLILASRRESFGIEFGRLLLDLLAAPGWTKTERDLLAQFEEGSGSASPDERTALTLFWLQHVASNLEKSSQYAHHWIWISRNVLPVLNHFSSGQAASAGVRG